MSFKVLVVDDSTFYRRRVREILNKDPLLEVVAEASNGESALEKITKFKPDVITMDVEMPVMDGITAVRRIMAIRPTPILMFSSVTQEGAQATLDALDAGALDFLPKNFEDIAKDRNEATTVLRAKVRSIAGRRLNRIVDKSISTPGKTTSTQKFIRSSNLLTGAQAKTEEVKSSKALKVASGKAYKMLAIGSSTGGPVALQKVLQPLPANFPCPIVIVQHMPGTFTTAFAQRLNSMCNIQVSEAQDGDKLKSGHAYLAPGGKQMRIEGTPRAAKIKVFDGPPGKQLMYKPSVDFTFESIAKVYSGEVLGLILTGMGADGRDGSNMLKNLGATIWAQDENSSVVYGMPQAVVKANIAERSLSLDQMAPDILVEMKG